MAGLYIHIPFCKSRCIYCAFYSTTQLELRQQYVDALCKEMDTLPPGLPDGAPISTIYLGGGTPSQLTMPQLQQLFTYIYNRYRVAPGAEVTIECNPDDIAATSPPSPAVGGLHAEALPQLGITRVSMGAQTFSDSRLRFLNRRHTAAQVPQAVSRLRQAGIRNISIDLMYGFPGETLHDWQRDIDAALALGVEHLSAYCLMVEEGTALYEQMSKEKREKNNDTDDELERQMYEMLIDRLEAAGYEHYEISHWSLNPHPLQGERGLKSYRAIHNSNYWHDVPYIGLGAAAHSYDGQRRYWNVSDLQEYIRRVENGISPVEDSEAITGWTRYNDRLTVALRTCEGLDLATLSPEQRDYCTAAARRFLDDGLLRADSSHLILTRRGLFVSDMVISELMFV